MPKIGTLGVLELLIILVVVLLIFGPRRLPEMAKGLGQSVREFRRGIKDMGKEIEEDAKGGGAKQAAPVSAATTSAATTAEATGVAQEQAAEQPADNA